MCDVPAGLRLQTVHAENTPQEKGAKVERPRRFRREPFAETERTSKIVKLRLDEVRSATRVRNNANMDDPIRTKPSEFLPGAPICLDLAAVRAIGEYRIEPRGHVGVRKQFINTAYKQGIRSALGSSVIGCQ